MEYQPPITAQSGTSSFQHHSIPNSFPPVNSAGWNNKGHEYPGNEMTQNDFIQSHQSSSCFPPPPPLNFFQPPPPPPSFNSNRPPQPPVMNAGVNGGHHPPLNTNRPPPPFHFYQPTPSLDVSINRPPPPIPNPPSSFYQPPHQHGFSPNNNGSCYSTNQHRLPFNSSHPPAVPLPQQTNDISMDQSCSQVFNYNDQHMQERINFHHKKVEISNLPANQEKYETEIEKKKKIGQQRLASWLHKIGKVKKKGGNVGNIEKPTNVKMNEYLCKLQTYMASVSDLSSQVERLDSLILDADKSSWQHQCNTMETLKAKHKDLQSVVDKGGVEQVEKKLIRIRQKKARLKRSRHTKYLQIQDLEEVREAKEKEISDWQQKLSSEMNEDLMKKRRKQEMDQTLSEVTKKIHDANRLIDTMTALEKLRLIRQDAAKKRGDSELGESRQSFEQKISDMTRLVRSQLEVYREEEEKLRGVIKSEQDETSKKEKELQASRDKEEQKQRDEDLRKMLFGFSDDANLSDPLFPFQQYYKQAETSLPAFVHIRHEWDQYIVPVSDPDGSPIPSGWVQPPDPSSSDWASALI